MPNEEILKIASQITDQTIMNNYEFYLLVAAITFISAVASFFLSSYLKQRGQNLATKTDFQQILDQLHKSTTITEGIKSSITNQALDEINYKCIMREKLEQIFDETFKLELWLEQSRDNALDGELPATNSSPIAKIEMYQAIYFQKAKRELLHLQSSYYPMIELILNTAHNTANKSEPLVDTFALIQQPLMQSLISFREKLLEVYARSSGL